MSIFLINVLILTNILFEKDMEVDVDGDNIGNGIETATQTEVESDVPKISIPIERCTKSHR